MRKAGRYVTRALAAIGFLYVLVSVTPIDGWWIRFLAGPWNDPKGERVDRAWIGCRTGCNRR